MASSQKSLTLRKREPVDEIQTRPHGLKSKKGSTGAPIKLIANYFQLTSQTDWCLHQYRVDISPEEETTQARRALLRHHRDALGAYMFDGTVLYTNTVLRQPLEFNNMREDRTPVNIRIRLVGNLDVGDSHYFQFFNMIVRKCLEFLRLQLVGRNYFDAAARIEIPEYQLELWPGYVTSIRQHERNVLMCVEVSHKVMRDVTLLDILRDCLQRNRNDYRTLYSQQVTGCVVLTGYNNRTYRVDDVDYTVSPQSTFTITDGNQISYSEYYRTRYQITIRDLKQPLLVSRSRMRDIRAGQPEVIYLIPELCRMTGITDQMRADFRLMKALSVHTRIAPGPRMNRLLTFNQRLHRTPEVMAEFNQWNFNLSRNLLQVPGRVLPTENIYFGNRKIVPAKNGDWNFPLQENMPATCGKLEDWVAIVPSRNSREAETFIQAVITAGNRVGFRLQSPRVFQVRDDRIQSLEPMITKIMNENNPQLVLVVVSNNQLQRYAYIKRKLCIDRPVPSQVIVARTLTQKSPSMLNAVGCKVATQLNCKMGGTPWTTDLWTPLPGTMVAGFDVCHDKAQGSEYGAMVASLDNLLGRYYSAVSHHRFGQELSNDLAVHLRRALEEFRRVNNRLPARIIFYRDGVGEGQIQHVHEFEVVQIKRMLADVYGSPDGYKFCFIIVTKRINTRLFADTRNPPPGTVVDDVITDPLKYDFFLVSQSVREGTVSPTAYNIIDDNTGIPPDKIQVITFKLCHMYFNFSGTVRVPAPCQYAHKLALLVSQAVRGTPSPRFQNSLYFL